MLHVRVLELLSQRVGVTPWQKYVDDFLQERWIRYLMMQRLRNVLDACLSRASAITNPADVDFLNELARRITTYQPGGYALDLRAGFNALADLARIFDSHDNTGRRVQEIWSTYALPELPGLHAKYEVEWKLTLERLRRVRNALAHGGPVDDESAQSVQAFAEQLARLALAVALQGLLEGKTVAAANQERRQWIDRWKAALPSAADVPDALFGPTP